MPPQPAENVNYVDAHDNETLFDLVTYKMPADAPMENRVRMSLISQASVALSQSPSFWASGTEMLRSKSLDRDSYNSGDYYNAIDWTMHDNGFGHGLPVKSKNGAAWDHMRPLLENPDLKPSPEQIDTSSEIAMDFLRVRSSSRLFTLGSADLIRSKVTFPNSGDGGRGRTIVMLINDEAGAGSDVDAALDGALVVFNATDKTMTTAVDGLAGRVFKLHEAQANGSDAVVKDASFDAKTGSVTVPARTVAVFTQAAGDRIDPNANPAPDPETAQWVASGDGRWWLRYADGSYPAGERVVRGGVTYSFDASGWMKTGWQLEDGAWRYYAPSGAMATGWTTVGGTWYYLDPDTGAMATGWLKDGNIWYYLNGSGSMATGWVNLGGAWYYLNGNGTMATGWAAVGGSWVLPDGVGPDGDRMGQGRRQLVLLPGVGRHGDRACRHRRHGLHLRPFWSLGRVAGALKRRVGRDDSIVPAHPFLLSAVAAYRSAASSTVERNSVSLLAAAMTEGPCWRPGWRPMRSMGPEIDRAARTRPDGPRTGAETEATPGSRSPTDCAQPRRRTSESIVALKDAPYRPRWRRSGSSQASRT